MCVLLCCYNGDCLLVVVVYNVGIGVVICYKGVLFYVEILVYVDKVMVLYVCYCEVMGICIEVLVC